MPPDNQVEHPFGKVAVVTGAASGVGHALAARLAEMGMNVVLADIEDAALSDAVGRLAKDGHSAIGVVTDVRSQDSVDELAAQVEQRLGPPDVLCSSAGVAGALGMSWQLPLEMWRWVLETNLMGTVHAVRSFVPEMIARDRGTVINVSSVGGLLALPASTPYSVSKFGIVALTEALAEELQMRGSQVKASVACLGEVRTRIADDLRNWPTDLGPVPAESQDQDLSELAREVRAAIDGGSDPRAIAETVLSQAAEGRLWIHTHLVECRSDILRRTEAITAAAE